MLNILIVGVGGQGTLFASRVFGDYAVKKGLDCKLSEVHGMAQRGGSVVTHVKMGEKVYSPIIDAGTADAVLAFEELEALRVAHYIKDNGCIIVNSQKISPLPVIIGAAKYPDEIVAKIAARTKLVMEIDALDTAISCGSAKCVNTVILGAATKALNLDFDAMLEAVKTRSPKKAVDANESAFRAGYEFQK